MFEPECRQDGPPFGDLLGRVERRPEAGGGPGSGSGVWLDAKRAWEDCSRGYDYTPAGEAPAQDSSPDAGADATSGAGADGDRRSRGKDLYDAVLLAPDPATRLSARLLRTVFRRAGCGDFSLDAVRGWDVEWEYFRERHPAVDGTAADWLDQLAVAVGAMLADDARRASARRPG